ncbi:alpha/beta fold hydrolase [Roseibium marinum]|uniref:Pimeloyl-ACP methyl ester carboxylesterase n=1 Tax=Roseibium marinum TaxID=281252 RepID=A0A2S3UX46_9HYPH|nr:alpha/beta hydrolase [Roseibium marinum]POF32288.1 pimeloyl-ACP methyl ester carboxylesterase [Roseibium marinum]
MRLILSAVLSFLALSAVSKPAPAVTPYSATFHEEKVGTNGTVLHVRAGGTGPAVVLLHGFADTGDMWQPLAEILVRDHTVIVPDLRGMGLSAHPETGYEKINQAKDIAGVMDHFGASDAVLVTHDIGNMVGYALAAQYRDRITRWVVIDAPLPGIGNWNAVLLNPRTWHFNFRGPDVERLVAGRERILLDRFYNDLSATPSAIDEETREHYAALYALPHAMHNALGGQFAAFAQDARDNQALLAKDGKLSIPVLAIGGDHSFGAGMASELSFVATSVQGAVIPDAGHWIMEEQPQAAIDLIAPFIMLK